jgi:cytochrome c oxidase subunit 1
MSRRIPTYNADSGFNEWNMMATIGAFTIAVSLLVFFYNIFVSYRAHKRNPVDVGPDPWDARSLEWMVPSPTPEHNFDRTPTIVEFDHFWHLKYGHDDQGRAVRIANTADVVQDGSATDVHLPSPSYWPIVLASGLPFIGYGVIFNPAFAVIGALLVLAGMIGWVLEPPDAIDGGSEGHGDADHGDAGHATPASAKDAEAAGDDAPSNTAGDGNE